EPKLLRLTAVLIRLQLQYATSKPNRTRALIRFEVSGTYLDTGCIQSQPDGHMEGRRKSTSDFLFFSVPSPHLRSVWYCFSLRTIPSVSVSCRPVAASNSELSGRANAQRGNCLYQRGILQCAGDAHLCQRKIL